MIFSTFNQFNIFLIFIFFGFIFGFIYNLINIIFLLKFAKNLKKIIIFCCFYTVFCCFFVILLNLFNFGIVSPILIFAFVFGFFWCNKAIRNLVVFYENKWYNTINKIKILRRKKHASKSKKN